MPVGHGQDVQAGAGCLRVVRHVGAVPGTGSVVRIITGGRLSVAGGRARSGYDALIAGAGLVRTVGRIVHRPRCLRGVRAVHLIAGSTYKVKKWNEFFFYKFCWQKILPIDMFTSILYKYRYFKRFHHCH